ncbi:MAG: hypothetical protein KC620_03895 [Myxococcales bacterium]|nr:hypothetical protein [Myxococcales bacterium]
MRLALAFALLAFAGVAFAAEPAKPELIPGPQGTVVVLHAVPCLIREAETDPLPYKVTVPADCERINRATAAVRESGFRTLTLTAGKYIFRVHNDGVPWLLDFDLRGERDPSLPFTQGGTIAAGKALDYPITLVPGVYAFHSPRDASPRYRLVVEAPAKAR